VELQIEEDQLIYAFQLQRDDVENVQLSLTLVREARHSWCLLRENADSMPLVMERTVLIGGSTAISGVSASDWRLVNANQKGNATSEIKEGHNWPISNLLVYEYREINPPSQGVRLARAWVAHGARLLIAKCVV
jgi:hypothetical protein